MARHTVGGSSLVDLRIRKAGRERSHAPSGEACHRGRNRSGIDSTRKEGADGYIGQHVPLDRAENPISCFVDPLGFAAPMQHLYAWLPILPEAGFADGADGEEMARRDRSN